MFEEVIWENYRINKRRFPWRKTTNPYRIVISEIMLQQTQTSRVVPKYLKFIKRFPNFSSLAKASVSDLMLYWQGLGYNRRALALKKIAELIMTTHNGKLPDNPEVLQTFPGIGKATASSIIVFAYNKPFPFIETNIRRVFIHFFFQDQENIDDRQIMPLIEETIDKENPREWFYALMDYGNMLGQKENVNVKSKHYLKQSKFEGSKRQLRGKILKYLTYHQAATYKQLLETALEDEPRLQLVLDELTEEGFIEQNEKELWHLKEVV